MKVSKTAPSPTREIDFYKNFMRLGRERRRRIAVRILRNQRLLADLHDHFLIQDSLAERGKNLAWEAYLRGNGAER